jgi:hypothetical protein
MAAPPPPGKTPKSAAALPKSQKRKPPAKPRAKTVAKKTRSQLIATGEALPSLFDIKPDEHGCLSTSLVMPPKANKRSWAQFLSYVRSRDVMWLRLHKGMTFWDIANYLDLDIRTVERLWAKRHRADLDIDIEELRALEVQRMDDWLSMLEPNIRKEIAAGLEDPTEVHYRALRQAVSIQANRVKLLGLEKPVVRDAQEDTTHLHKVDVSIDMRASAADFIAAAFAGAGGTVDPQTIIRTLQELQEGTPAIGELEGEALTDFLADIDSEIEIIDVAEVQAEVDAVMQDDGAPTNPEEEIPQ